jgi:hypothetical protein
MRDMDMATRGGDYTIRIICEYNDPTLRRYRVMGQLCHAGYGLNSAIYTHVEIGRIEINSAISSIVQFYPVIRSWIELIYQIVGSTGAKFIDT